MRFLGFSTGMLLGLLLGIGVTATGHRLKQAPTKESWPVAHVAPVATGPYIVVEPNQPRPLNVPFNNQLSPIEPQPRLQPWSQPMFHPKTIKENAAERGWVGKEFNGQTYYIVPLAY